MLAYEDAKRPEIKNTLCTTCGNPLKAHWHSGNGAKPVSLLVVKHSPKCPQFTNPNLKFLTVGRFY